MKFNGVTTYQPLEASPHAALLTQFMEQLRLEKCGGSYMPLRLVYAGDSSEKELIESCMVEDSLDAQKEFPYSEFLCSLHKLIRNKAGQ